MPLSLRFACLAFLLGLQSTVFAATTLHVALHGSDENPGSDDQPLATLARARDLARWIRQSESFDGESITIRIHAGTYYLSETLELTEQDSGSSQAPIRFEAAPGEEVILSGGIPLDSPIDNPESSILSGVPELARSNVLVFHVPHIDSEAVSQLSRRVVGQPTPVAPLEVFSSEGILPRSGWPNKEWALLPDDVAHSGSWTVHCPSLAHEHDDIWAHGFWSHDWEDRYEKLHVQPHSDRADHLTFRLHPPARHPRPKARYRLENLLSQLNSPGEWFFDAQKDLIYVWPPAEENCRLVASHLETVVSVYDVSHVSFEGLTIEAGRVMGVEIAGGSNVALRDCTIRYIGNVGVNVFHGEKHVVSHCEILHTGSSALRIDGGDRQTLLPGEHVCQFNDIHDCSYSFLARRPAISLFGVGTVVQNNRIHDLPDSAIGISGNDHIIDHNHIYNVCKLTADTGAIYLAHDPTFRGNVIRFNHIHDLGGYSDIDVVGIYLDDFASGTLVEGNLLTNTIRGIVIGGGRDNVLTNNIILDSRAAIQVDNRGTSWAKKHIEGENSAVREYCKNIGHDQAPYADRYPQLAQLLDDQPELAKGNTVEGNLIDCPIGVDLQDGANTTLVKVEGNRDAKQILAGVDRHDFEAILNAANIRIPENDSKEPIGRFVRTGKKAE